MFCVLFFVLHNSNVMKVTVEKFWHTNCHSLGVGELLCISVIIDSE